ncbi:alpha-L-fucosidase C-terminal domain-containing protein [Photobacterium sp. DNB23_23_1]
MYNTRPFHVYGEGPTIVTEQNRKELNHKGYNYTAEDIRFTRSKDWKTLYAIALDWPGVNQVLTITSLKLGTFDLSELTSITMPGIEGKLAYLQTAQGLEVTMPSNKPT